MQTRYDLAIIGSGGGAFAAAIRATSLGKSVVMVERGTFGGTCVNTGCVPSKALIAAAEARHVAADAPTRFPGIASVAGAVDMPALIGGKQDLVEALRGEKYVDVADSYGWQVRRGNAAFAGTPDSPLLEVAAAQVGLVDGGNLELPAIAWRDGLSDIDDRIIVEIQPHDGMIRPRFRRLFFNAERLAGVVEFDDSVALRI